MHLRQKAAQVETDQQLAKDVDTVARACYSRRMAAVGWQPMLHAVGWQPKQSVVTSWPQHLTSRVVSVEESDSDAEQSANFAVVMQRQLASYLD